MTSRAAGWVVATVDSDGILHLDWDGELHPDRADAEREWAKCRAAASLISPTISALEIPSMTDSKYRTIVADPPWDHSDGTGFSYGSRHSSGKRLGEGGTRRPPYQPMTLEEIAANR